MNCPRCHHPLREHGQPWPIGYARASGGHACAHIVERWPGADLCGCQQPVAEFGLGWVLVNGRWPLLLPQHRAERPEWPWWEAARLAAMHHVLRSGSGHVVWDVGAEEGDLPALWASWGAEVVLAEPNPAVWPNIALVWRANGLPDPAGCWEGFLANEGTSWASARQWPACVDGPVIGDHGFCQLGERPDLPQTTMDLLVGEGWAPPTVVTIDVEGAELHVLAGAEATLAEHHPHVFVSVHPEFMLHHYGLGDGVGLVREWLVEGFGYGEQFLAIDHEHHWWFQPPGYQL